ncbi:MAG TPA: pantoate--beta-alanine ligase [Candidatus Deferrimicrobiaceae bacterium]
MELFRTPAEMQGWADACRREGRRIGFAPTMGALHAGHVSLYELLRSRRCNAVAASIFVNPTQFGPGEDFEKYPRDEARDLDMLRRAGVDAVLLPSVSDMYPEGSQTFVEVTGVSQGLCGAGRPGHFRGVATVVAKLFNIARPHVAAFGEKDYQQLAVIRRMALDLGFGIEIAGAPIVREADGLALSSRNRYLEGADRTAALCLSRGLFLAKSLFEGGERDPLALAAAVRSEIEGEPRAAIEYVEARHPETLEPVTLPSGSVTLLVAARVGPARLIDNITLHQGGQQ